MFNKVRRLTWYGQAIRMVGLAGLCIIGIGLPSFASEEVETHRAKIQVPDQSRETLVRAGRQALSEVMVKMSGQRDVISNPALKASMRDPTQMLRSYQFEMQDNQLYLVTDFDPAQIESLLREQGFPVWGQRRPDALLWLAQEEDNGNRFIVDEASLSPLHESITRTAQVRGVPVAMPLMDLIDSQAISIYDVWGQFASSLTQASQRYGVDYVIGARIYKNDGHSTPVFESSDDDGNQPAAQAPDGASFSAEEDELYQALASEREAERQSNATFTNEEFRQMSADTGEGDYVLDWILIGGDKTQFGTLYGDSPAQLSETLIQDYADYLASLFAIMPSDRPASENQISISVANLESLSRYVHAQRYLTSLNVVESAVLEKQNGSVGTFNLALLGSIDDFNNALSLESRLQPVRDAFGEPVEGMNFYWTE